MKAQDRVVVVLALVAIAGCGPHIQSARLVDRFFEPAAGEISVYSTRRPECPYEEIALITGSRRSAWNNLDDVLMAMRERARALGGDAIVGLGSGEEVSGTAVPDGVVSVDSNVILKGTVARFSDRNCRR
jgi:hypothetical protein